MNDFVFHQLVSNGFSEERLELMNKLKWALTYLSSRIYELYNMGNNIFLSLYFILVLAMLCNLWDLGF